MTDREIVHSLCCCNSDSLFTCHDCAMEQSSDCCSKLRTLAACRLDALSRAVEQKDGVSQETANSRENPMETGPQLEPERATEYISVSVAEYTRLTRAAAMLEVILAADEYATEMVVRSCRTAMEGRLQAGEGRGDQ